MNKLTLYDKSAIFTGFINQISTHSHHALQLIISLEGVISVEINDSIIETQGLIINQNIPHRVISNNKNLLIVLLEPILMEKEIIMSNKSGFTNIGLDSIDKIKKHIKNKNWDMILKEFTKNKEIKEIDHRIKYIIDHITKEENCKHKLEDFSKILKISKSRISHLFNKEVGISLKYYTLWMKTMFVIDSLRSSNDLTSIALDCGFTDLSHFSRTFRKMFGHTPSEIFKDSTSVQVDYQN